MPLCRHTKKIQNEKKKQFKPNFYWQFVVRLQIATNLLRLCLIRCRFHVIHVWSHIASVHTALTITIIMVAICIAAVRMWFWHRHRDIIFKIGFIMRCFGTRIIIVWCLITTLFRMLWIISFHDRWWFNIIWTCIRLSSSDRAVSVSRSGGRRFGLWRWCTWCCIIIIWWLCSLFNRYWGRF